MPVFSMACPKCGSQATEYAENKWQCLRCGVKFVYEDEKPPVINVHQVYESGETVQQVLCCPKCGNRNVQLKKMVYEAGTHTTILAGVGPALGSEGLGGWIGGGESQSLLARRCKPPQSPDWLWALATVSAVLATCCLLLVLAAAFNSPGYVGIPLFMFAVCVAVALSAGGRASSVSKSYRRDLRIWNETVVCLACGHEFPLNPRVPPTQQGQQAEQLDYLAEYFENLEAPPKQQGQQAEQRRPGTQPPPPPPVPRRLPRGKPLPPEQSPRNGPR
jgi:predicted nucleic-acid-binding Zn-ribbon protein